MSENFALYEFEMRSFTLYSLKDKKKLIKSIFCILNDAKSNNPVDIAKAETKKAITNR